MRKVVWVVSVLLALTFLVTGGIKLLSSTPDLEASAMGVPVLLLRIAGAAELLGALGLVLPAATRVLPFLAPVAAAGLVLTMIGATITNIVTGTYAVAVSTVALGVLAGFVAWARATRVPVSGRGPRPARAPVQSQTA